MRRIGVMMSEDRPDAQVSSHFGKAAWIMIAEPGGEALRFVPNEGGTGRSAAEIVIGNGCTDVILVDIGDGALKHLQDADIRVSAAPGAVTGNEALAIFADGKLPVVPAARAPIRHGGGRGCYSAGHGES